MNFTKNIITTERVINFGLYDVGFHESRVNMAKRGDLETRVLDRQHTVR